MPIKLRLKGRPNMRGGSMSGNVSASSHPGQLSPGWKRKFVDNQPYFSKTKTRGGQSATGLVSPKGKSYQYQVHGWDKQNGERLFAKGLTDTVAAATEKVDKILEDVLSGKAKPIKE